MMWSAEDVIALRKRLRLEPSTFARLMGVNPRSVTRWETGTEHPRGASAAVLEGLRAKLDQDPRNAEIVVEFLNSSARVGGLSYALVRLLDMLTNTQGRRPRE